MIRITKKYNAKQAILEDLKDGRRISQLDAHRYGVEDIRTPISHLRERFEDTHTLKSRWITTPLMRARIKEYWLEAR